MLKISHIIHPGPVASSSDLVVAQPITFETMRIASDFARGVVDTRLFAVQFHDEERMSLPGCFVRTRDLQRSIMDLSVFDGVRKLAILKDILDRLYVAEPEADYMIYTNVDIALQPYFYSTVAAIAQQGYDAFIINRRILPDHYKQTSEIPLMFSELGGVHPGSDCFVFKRDLYKEFVLENVAIGCHYVGLALRTNVNIFAQKFRHFRDLHLTFHIGDQQVWNKHIIDARYNQKELEVVFAKLLENENVVNRPKLEAFVKQFQSRIARVSRDNDL